MFYNIINDIMKKIVEAIEYKDKNYFIVGVHFHPEWDDDKSLFERLIEEGEKRNNG